MVYVVKHMLELTVYLKKKFDCNHSVYDFIYIFKTHMYLIKKMKIYLQLKFINS